MTSGEVVLYVAGTRLLHATKYDISKKYDNDTADTFDGKVMTQGPPTHTVKISQISSYNAKYESILQNAIDNAGDAGIPIVVVDRNLTMTFTGCVIDDDSMSRSPKSRATRDFSFTAAVRKEDKWK
jgi:hypothetical protein